MDPTGSHALSLYKVERQLQVYLKIPRLTGKAGSYSAKHPQSNLSTGAGEISDLEQCFREENPISRLVN